LEGELGIYMIRIDDGNKKVHCNCGTCSRNAVCSYVVTFEEVLQLSDRPNSKCISVDDANAWPTITAKALD